MTDMAADFDCINLIIKLWYLSCSEAWHNQKNLAVVPKKLNVVLLLHTFRSCTM